MKLHWKGDEVLREVKAAEIIGVNKTMGACVTTAKMLVNVDTSLLQGSIRSEPAIPFGTGVVGHWGSFDVSYAFWQEVLPEPRGKAYIRPAADAHYPRLAGFIRGAM
jgi:hypothetical protein